MLERVNWLERLRSQVLGHDSVSLPLAWALAIALAPFGKITFEMLLERDLSVPVEPVSPQVPVAIREADEADLDAITALYSQDDYLYLGDEPAAPSGSGQYVVEPKARAQYYDRMARGEKCFLALAGKEIVHVNWICFSWGDAVPGYPIFLLADEVYTTDAFTARKFRGQDIHAMVLGHMLRYAQSRGSCRAYTITRLDRRASFVAFRRLRWCVTGRFLCFVPRGSERSWLLRLSGKIDPLLRGPAAPATK
jgi:GNAT superfamily N-acetyltransferase